MANKKPDIKESADDIVDQPKSKKGKKVKIPSPPKEKIDPEAKRKVDMMVKSEKKIHRLLSLRSFMIFLVVMILLVMITVVVYMLFQKIGFFKLKT
ncbi:MAG: hypothetical protein RSA99_04355 [Oscillospiraceae bacterium]